MRGWLARRRCKELRKHRPPADPRLKRTWAAERLEESTSKLVAEMDAERGDLDRLFAELDASLALSRAVCDELTGPAARRLQERLEVRRPVWTPRFLSLEPVRPRPLLVMPACSLVRAPPQAAEVGHYDGGASSGVAAADGRRFDHLLRQREREEQLEEEQRRLDGEHGSSAAATAREGERLRPQASRAADDSGVQAQAAAQQQQPEVDWPAVVQRAKARGTTECPICIGRLNRKGQAGQSLPGGPFASALRP